MSVDVPATLAHALGRIESRAPSEAPMPEQLEELADLGRVVMLVGPGVVSAGAVDGLRAFAASANLGVANTWGAKGVFRWDDPHHLGTVGLQRDDFALLALADTDLVVTSGLDPDETPMDPAGFGPRVDVAPEDLGSFAARVPSNPREIVTTELYQRIAAIAGAGYASHRSPRHPAAAVAHLRSEHGEATVIAEPGLAGFWVARTFPTERLGSVVIPARGEPGVALELARLAATQGLRVALVTTLATTPQAFPVVVWGDDIDFSLTDELVEAAGPVVGIHGARLSR